VNDLAVRPRTPLAFLPTPLHRLPRLEAELGGPRLLVKRDDQTGLGLGGNKTRKLEFLVGAALEAGADVLVTAGAAQSNHCRQTAAAAAARGLDCHLLLGGAAPARPDGNLLLDRLFGATVHWCGDQRKGERLAEVVAGLRAAGRRPCEIPYGGSSATGALGYVAAMHELRDQLDAAGERVDAIVFASSSGGTQAGMAVGARACGLDAELVGIRIDKDELAGGGYAGWLAALASETAGLAGVAAGYDPGDFVVEEGYLGAGYGVVGAAEREAIGLFARREGLLLDPVYTGRAAAGLLDMLRRGRFAARQTVLFWHTGGAPALFPYADDLMAS
jgi:D-cysteine desulfhydrase